MRAPSKEAISKKPEIVPFFEKLLFFIKIAVGQFTQTIQMNNFTIRKRLDNV